MMVKTKKPAPKTGRSAAKKPRSSTKRKTAAARRSRSPASRRDPVLIRVVRALSIGTAAACLGAFCYWAARVTFTPVHDHGQAIGNTEVGHSLRFYLDRPSVKEAVRQVGGNLVLLAPLGILLPIVFPRLRALPRIVIAGALISAGVETVQGGFVAGRAFDVDDVLLNVIGITVAYLLAGRKITTLVKGQGSR